MSVKVLKDIDIYFSKDFSVIRKKFSSYSKCLVSFAKYMPYETHSYYSYSKYSKNILAQMDLKRLVFRENQKNSKYSRNSANMFVFAQGILTIIVEIRKIWDEFSVFDIIQKEQQFSEPTNKKISFMQRMSLVNMDTTIGGVILKNKILRSKIQPQSLI